MGVVLVVCVGGSIVVGRGNRPLSAPALQDASQTSGPGGALYLGKLPTKVVGEYFAILPMRPPQGHKVLGGVCTQTAGGVCLHHKLSLTVSLIMCRPQPFWACNLARSNRTCRCCSRCAHPAGSNLRSGLQGLGSDLLFQVRPPSWLQSAVDTDWSQLGAQTASPSGRG